MIVTGQYITIKTNMKKFIFKIKKILFDNTNPHSLSSLLRKKERIFL